MPVGIKEWPEEDRPREKLVSKGAAALTDAELMSVILCTGHAKSGRNVLELARDVLQRFGTLAEMGSAGMAEMTSVPGIGQAKAVQLFAALELGRRSTLGGGAVRLTIRSSRDLYDAYKSRLRDLKQEMLLVVLLDARNRRFKDLTVAMGSLTELSVHPRDVFAQVIRESAAAIALIHNHPSGDPSPSLADIDFTRRMADSATMLGIRFLDHVIVGAEHHVSLAEEGLLGDGRRMN